MTNQNQIIEKAIKDYLKNYAYENQYRVSPIPVHTHNGVDSPQIDPQNLLGFPVISSSDATVAPTDTPNNGTIRIYYDNTHWRLWVRVNNLWKSATLT